MVRRSDEIWAPIGWLSLGLVIGAAAASAVTVGPGRRSLMRARRRVLELSSSEPISMAKTAATRFRDLGSDPNHAVRRMIDAAAKLAGRREIEPGTGEALELRGPAENGALSSSAPRGRRRAAEPIEE
ncbi:MAG TPA: hypothetical protein VND96_13475 [Candidatus Micrarchaeaceae archaeon]|nr:hypothetical protein [Candidatus Micrarchaeaceae archaeon]